MSDIDYSSPYVIEAMVGVAIGLFLFGAYIRQMYVAAYIHAYKTNKIIGVPRSRNTNSSTNSETIRQVRLQVQKRPRLGGSSGTSGSGDMEPLPQSESEMYITMTAALWEAIRPKTWTLSRMLSNFRGNSLVFGPLGALALILNAVDPRGVNGIWTDFAMQDFTGRINTIIGGFLMMSYVIAVISASFTASNLGAQRPFFVFYSMFSAYMILTICGLVISIISFAGSYSTAVYRPYFISFICFELCLVVGFDVAFYRFRKSVKSLTNSRIQRAVRRMWRMFVLTQIFLCGAIPIQIYQVFSGLEDRDKDNDPDNYKAFDDTGLFFSAFVYLGVLYLAWQDMPKEQEVTIASVDSPRRTDISSELVRACSSTAPALEMAAAIELGDHSPDDVETQ